MKAELAVTLAAAVPLACDMLDRCISWARRRWQMEIEEGVIYPPFRLVCWLRVKRHHSGYDHDVLLVRLPSYRWQEDYSRDNRWEWAQLVLRRRGHFSNRTLEAPGRKLWSAHWVGLSYLT